MIRSAIPAAALASAALARPVFGDREQLLHATQDAF